MHYALSAQICFIKKKKKKNLYLCITEAPQFFFVPMYNPISLNVFYFKYFVLFYTHA